MLFRSLCVAAYLLCSSALYATDLRPWPTHNLEVVAHALLTTQYYKSIDTRCGSVLDPSFNTFLNLGAEFSACDLAALEAEVILARTKVQSLGFDSARFTARYFLSNDIVDDSLSAALGVTVIPVFRHADKDPGSFHHGDFEGEVHVSIGRECSMDEFWLSRWWNVAALGMGNDGGSPWIRTESVWEKNYCGCFQWRLFVNTLWGLGTRDFPCCVKDFEGYGKLRHQSIDVGTGYSCYVCDDAELSLDFAFRIYAKNYPERACTLTLGFYYPFGL